MQMDELGSDPSTPSAGTARLFIRDDNTIKVIFDSGTVVNLGAASVSTLDDLDNVTIAGLATNDHLKYNGTNFVNEPHTLTNVNDVTITTPSNGEALLYNAGTWENGVVASTIDGLTDTNITSIADNQILTYDSGSSKWINETPSAAGSLTGLSDTTITTPVDGHGLIYNGSAWINQFVNPVMFMEGTNYYLVDSQETDILINNGGVVSTERFINGMTLANNVTTDKFFRGLTGTDSIIRVTAWFFFDANNYGVDTRGDYVISWVDDVVGNDLSGGTQYDLQRFDSSVDEYTTVVFSNVLGDGREGAFRINNQIGQDADVDYRIMYEILGTY